MISTKKIKQGHIVDFISTAAINADTIVLNTAKSYTDDLVALRAPLASPTFTGVITTTGGNSTNWSAAFGWGNHAGLYSLISHDHTLASLTDTTITTPTAGQFLEWNGTKWVNNILIAADIPVLDTSKITTGVFAAARIPAISTLSGTLADAQFSGSYTGLTNLTGNGTVDFNRFLGNTTDTALLPSFSFTSDPNTGIWSVGADQLGITTGGVSRITISTTLINTTLPITSTGIITASGGNSTNWNSAFSQTLQWNGGATNLVASTGRTSLGATTIGGNIFTSTNPTAVTFLRANVDNSITWLDASTFRSAIGAGTSTVTPSALTKVDDTNVTLTLGGSFATSLLATASLTLGWTGTLADSRIASAATWNAKQTGSTNLTSLTSLAYVSNSFVKMSAAGTFSLDTTSYLPLIGGTMSGPLTNPILNAGTLGQVGTGTAFRLYGAGSAQYGISVNSGTGGIEYMSNQTVNPSHRFFGGADNTAPKLLATIQGDGILNVLTSVTTQKLLLGSGAFLTNSYFRVGQSVNGHLQANVNNTFAGALASSDWVATANNGTDTTNFINMGINSSANTDASWTMAGANDGYVFINGGHLAIGTATAAKDIKFFTAGSLAANEKMRVFGATGNVLIQNTGTFTDNGFKLDIQGTARITGIFTMLTAAVDTNTTQAATTAFVLGQASSVAPLINGTVAIGTSLRFARADHVHPVDTSRQTALNGTGLVRMAGTAVSYDNASYQTIGATHFIGTTSIANNRASLAQTLTGVSIDGSAGSVAWGGITSKPTTISGYGITNAVTHMDGSRDNTNINTRLTSGFYNLDTVATNGPAVGVPYSQLIVAKGVDTGLQIIGGHINDNLWFRGWQGSGSSFTTWRKIIHDGNFNEITPNLSGTALSLNIGGNIVRQTHSSGVLVGSYNVVGTNAGPNAERPNPIYVIGSAYMPTNTTLSNMYGIGFSTEGLWGAGKTTGFGLYTVENGNVQNTISTSGIWTQGGVKASAIGGFSCTNYTPNGRSAIYYLGDAPGYGLSYFQGTAGITSGVDTIGIHFGTATAAGSQFTFLQNGVFRASNDIIAFASSDSRLKDNIKPIPNALDKISKIGGYEFDWNEKQNVHIGHDIGVIAEEIEEVLPEIVMTRDNGYKAVKYDKLVALLIEGIKEQQIQINELKEIIKNNNI